MKWSEIEERIGLACLGLLERPVLSTALPCIPWQALPRKPSRPRRNEHQSKRPACGEPRWERGWWQRHGTSRDVASRRVGNATDSVILRLLRSEASVRQQVTVAATHFHSCTLPLTVVSFIFTVSYRASKLMSRIPPPHSMVGCNYYTDSPNQCVLLSELPHFLLTEIQCVVRNS